MAHLRSPVRNSEGQLVPGATVTIYRAGTTNVVDLFSDPGLTTALTNPLVTGDDSVLDVYLDSGSVDILIERADIEDRTIEDVDVVGTLEPGGSLYVLSGQTTDATLTELLDSSSGRISVPSGSTLYVEALIVGQEETTGTDSAAYRIECRAKNVAGTTTVANVTEAFPSEDDAAWDVDIAADDTNDAINVNVTGAAATTVNWVARVLVVEAS